MSSMMGDFAMSSLVDNIILMNWIEIGDAFRLGLTVAKMPPTRPPAPPMNARSSMARLARPAAQAAGRFVPGAVLRYQGLISRAPTRRPGSMAPDGDDESR